LEQPQWTSKNYFDSTSKTNIIFKKYMFQ